MTLRQIVETIASIVGTEDEKVRVEITELVHVYRAKYLKQHIDKYGVDKWMSQSFGLPLSLLPNSPLCNAGCLALQGRIETTTIRGTPLKVRTIDGKPLAETTEEKALMQKYEKYTSKSLRYLVNNVGILVLNSSHLKYVIVDGVFEYPHKLNSMTNCVNCGLDFEEYPLPIDYISIIIQEIANLYQRPQDASNQEMR